MATHEDRVTRQFSEGAKRYLNSEVHSRGLDLDWIVGMVEQNHPRNLLDLGSGAGHVSFRVSPHVQTVTALDPSSEMLATVRGESVSRGLQNIVTRVGQSDAIPFESGTFDWIVSRYSAHHWADLRASLHECARVLSPGGRILLVDSVSSENALLDTWLQAIELLRDTTHVRSYRVSEWTALLEGADFRVVSLKRRKLVLPYLPWLQRAGTSETRTGMIGSLFDLAPDEVRDSFVVKKSGDLMIDVMEVEAVSSRE
ncbi:MAG: class I SAM-dependent methyltransferase [Leptospirales bacterium]